MLFLFCLLAVLLYLAFEWCRHLARLRALLLRIHVHGTRGKSSLTREVAERLRQRGIRTLARTTGDRPELILPDGSLVPWKRRGPARIKEYMGIIRQAEKRQCRAVVVECMALQPENVSAARRLLRANIVLITNTRPDHQEVMGESYQDVARVMALLFQPERGGTATEPLTVIAQEDQGSPVLVAAAKAAACPLRLVGRDRSTRPWEASAQLAAAFEEVLDDVFPDLRGREGFLSPPPHGLPGLCRLEGSSHFFLDLFSVNDVTSAGEVVRDFYSREHENGGREPRPWIALFASRADRPLRTRAFMSWLRNEACFDSILPVGGHCWYASRRLPAARRVSLSFFERLAMPRPCPNRLLALLEKKFGPCVVVGLGNTHGYGERFRRYAGERQC